MNEHKLVEMMASTWDQDGHRPPRDWRVICTCGFTARALPGQIEASDAWAAHLDETRSAAA